MREAVGNWALTLNDKKFQGNARGCFYYYCYLVAPERAEKIGKHICETLKAMIQGLNSILYRAGNKDGLPQEEFFFRKKIIADCI